MEIVTYNDTRLNEVKQLANLVLALRNDVLKPEQDYGIIPGTEKPTLLLPGMEKLLRALHLRPEYVPRAETRDFDKPLFYFEFECRLVDYDTGVCVSTAIGSANSYETKWRYRQANRVCPHCGKPAIIKGKAEYGGGWLCFAKKNGCGAKFRDNDPLIVDQPTGRVENTDIFDQVNTILKIAQKRALGSAIKGAANVSEFFTVDLEDFQTYDVTPVVERPQLSRRPAHDADGVILPEPRENGAVGPQTVGNWANAASVTKLMTSLLGAWDGVTWAEMCALVGMDPVGAPERWNVYESLRAAGEAIEAALKKATEQGGRP